MTVTYKPTNVVISPFIRYSGTSAYTSVEAGVASCLLFDTETEFRRLRDDFWDGLVLELGMKRLGGIELPRKEYVGSSRETGAIGARES